MYIPQKYRLEDPELAREFLQANAFGLLVSGSTNGPVATHLPLEVVPDMPPLALTGHFARANTQWRDIGEGQEVLCIFQGAHSYVSPSWYSEEEVPTWNYMAAHIRGTYHTHGEQELMAALRRLVDKYERDSRDPVSLDQFSEKTMRQVRGVVGFTVHVTQVDVAFKLSQGRETDHPRIIEGLRQRGGLSAAVADAMEKHFSS